MEASCERAVSNKASFCSLIAEKPVSPKSGTLKSPPKGFDTTAINKSYYNVVSNCAAPRSADSEGSVVDAPWRPRGASGAWGRPTPCRCVVGLGAIGLVGVD